MMTKFSDAYIFFIQITSALVPQRYIDESLLVHVMDHFAISCHWASVSEVVQPWLISHTIYKLMMETWWRHQMEAFSALLTLSAGNSPVPGEFPSQRSVTRIFDVFFELRLNNRLIKQSWGWWSDTPSHSLWRHCNELCEVFCLLWLSIQVTICTCCDYSTVVACAQLGHDGIIVYYTITQ